MSTQPTPPEWEAWSKGEGRCPICAGLAAEDFEATCDCFQFEREFPEMAARPWPSDDEQPEFVFEDPPPGTFPPQCHSLDPGVYGRAGWADSEDPERLA